ncbi:hypothetical protein BH10BDE1_BH10BDE1_08930 [soil metagenome]
MGHIQNSGSRTLSKFRFVNEFSFLGLLLIAAGVLTGALTGCAHNANKAEVIDTKIDNKGQVTGDTSVGVKEGNMVVQKKVMMNEELRRIQNEVYELEDRVYGNRKYGSLGLYGVLKTCRGDLAAKTMGGNGKLQFTEPIDRVTDKEDEYKVGLDDKKQLVGVSEEFLKDRIERFKQYKMVLQKRQDEYEDKVEICKNEVKSRQGDQAKMKSDSDKASAPMGNTAEGN